MFSNLIDLETNGFVILKNLVSSEEINLLIENYNKAKGMIIFLFPKEKSTLKSLLTSILENINRETKIKTDWVSPSGVYFSNDVTKLDWHQDHEIFYKTQDTFNNLNFWIPIIKPNINQDGLRLLPHKVLREKLPEITENYILHKGAQRYKFKDNKTIIFNDDAGTQKEFDEDILALSEEIQIGVGDILIFRGDMIHKTADRVNNRVAIAVRSTYQSTIFSKSKFFNDCVFKQNQIKNNPKNYCHIINKLNEESDREFFKIDEFVWSTSFRGTPKHFGLKNNE
jgi:hypothetical protein